MPTQFWRATPGPEEVGRLRRAVVAYAGSHGIPDDRLHDVAMAVTEIVSNAVMHAYPDGSDGGRITVMASADGDELTVRVYDDGIGLRPRTDSPGAGLGMLIAGSVARRMSVERPPHGGTEISMTFAAAA